MNQAPEKALIRGGFGAVSIHARRRDCRAVRHSRDQRAAVIAAPRERDALRDASRRLEHLIAELQHVVQGKRSEMLGEDGRQLACEELETAIAEVEAQQARTSPPSADPGVRPGAIRAACPGISRASSA